MLNTNIFQKEDFVYIKMPQSLISLFLCDIHSFLQEDEESQKALLAKIANTCESIVKDILKRNPEDKKEHQFKEVLIDIMEYIDNVCFDFQENSLQEVYDYLTEYEKRGF